MQRFKVAVILSTIWSTIWLASCAPQADHSELIANTRSIVGGIPVEANSDISSSAVFLLVDQAPNKGRQYCSGTLIAQHLVLTAAHCVLRNDDPASPVPPEQISLFFGPAEFDTDDLINPVRNDLARKTAYKAVFHEKHIGHYQDQDVNDIALIQFRGDLPQALKPASILPAEQASVPLQIRTEVQVAGFGFTRTNDPLTQLTLLQTSLVTAFDEGDSIIRLATSQFENRGLCDGDSGGPAFIEIDDKLYLWAVNIQSNCRTQSWVLSLAPFHPWMKRKAAELRTESPHYINLR
jgi:hypothetical protein